MKITTTKKLLLSTFTGLALLLPASAATFDSAAFGQSLNGWRKNRTASYNIDNHSYLTHKPTVTPSPGGGIFISTRIEHRAAFGKKTTSYIELSYSGEGTLITAQIRIMAGDKKLNTGLIKRPALVADPAEGEAAVADAEPWNTPTKVLIQDLFKSLDTEFAKAAKLDLEGKKDVFSRVFGKGYQSADLAAALRHNLNLVMGCTR
ncbi:hypothetical protein V2O64_09575 [Verrucomicrobiaceae bacterium 227]